MDNSELLLEDFFEDIFEDPATSESADNVDDFCSEDPKEIAVTSASVEQSDAAGSSSKACKHKKSSLLNKKVREKLIQSLKSISDTDLLREVVKLLSKEGHMQHYPERCELLTSLLDSSADELQRICAGLAESFIDLYAKCSIGKEKYGRFQVEWHQYCSNFLLDPADDAADKLGAPALPLPKLWLSMTRSTPKHVRNPLMIAMSSAVYTHMLQEVRLIIKDKDEECQSSCAVESEADEVYYRFAGGALADMLKVRYKDMKSNKPSLHKEKISKELQVLNWMRLSDKSNLPSALVYRDRGGMYFPDEDLLPFIRSLDNTVREYTNKDAFQRYGKNLVKVVSELVHHNKLLREQFQTFIESKVDCVQLYEDSISAVYFEFSRKISNTRINEFLDTCRQKSAADHGKATLTGQNLRDTLLTQHVNLKSRSHHNN